VLTAASARARSAGSAPTWTPRAARSGTLNSIIVTPPRGVPVLGHGPGQHPLRPAGGDPGRGRGRRPGRRGRPGHRRPARRLRHPGRRAGRPAGRRGAPAGRLRPGLDRRPGPADPGRGHQQPGRGQRGPHHRRPPAATLGPDHHHHRPPAVHHRPGRPDRGGLRRPHRRGRHAGRAPRPWRPLRRPVRPLGRRRRLTRGGGRPHRSGWAFLIITTPVRSAWTDPALEGRAGWAGCSRRCSR
jgi:hypothetical protein